jgi:cell wall-associated NlpC family hydrolase
MACRSSSLGSGVISRVTARTLKPLAKAADGTSVGRRLAVAAAVVAAVPAGSAPAAAPARAPNWAAPQISVLASRGLLMGAPSVGDFHAGDPLTRGALSSLAFGLQQALTPPLDQLPVPPVDPGTIGGSLVAAGPAEPADPVTASTLEPAPPPTTADPASTTPGPVTTADPPPAPAPSAPPATPPPVAQPDASVSMAALDARLVSTLGLSRAASEFARGARAAGLQVPARFGTEVVARLLGLRTNHPAAQDFLELLPRDPATRAEAAYSGAQVLGLGWLGSSWQLAAVQGLADTFSLPQLTDWQRRVLNVAVSKIGMPYVWGGTSDGVETLFGVQSRGGYDCSGFIWRVYKLQRYPDGGALASTLRGRTTMDLSVEVPRSERIPLDQLQPADVLFFGDRGPRSTGPQVIHAGIYLGNGWFIHSSGNGVALSQLAGWYEDKFAWARRPLAEASLAS